MTLGAPISEAGGDKQTSERSIQKRRLLWIKADQLVPVNSGGRIRTYNMLKNLREHYHISYFCLGDPDIAATEAMRDYSDVQIVVPWKDVKGNKARVFFDLLLSMVSTPLPYVIYKYTRRRIAALMSQELEDKKFDIVVCDFLSLSANLIQLARKSDTTYVVFQHNVESRIWERHRDTAVGFVRRQFYADQSRRFVRFEKNACQWFDGVIAVSQADAQSFRHDFQLSNVLGHVETGVDVDFFTADLPRKPTANIVFLGSMDWEPNIDGILAFIEQCYPLVRASSPGISLTIVGRNPTPAIKRLAAEDSSINVTGTVDDVRPYLRSGAVLIVPLRVGGGTRIKIYEAMSLGLPVVSTSIGAEGLPLTHNENVMLADDWEYFAECTLRLINDWQFNEQMAARGQKYVRENYNWKTVTSDFCRMLESLGADSRGHVLIRAETQ